MSTAWHGIPKFLITPRIQNYESLRGYVARVARRNDALGLVQPELESISSATRSIPMFAKLTGTGSKVLRSHGSSEPSQELTTPKVRFGHVLVPASQVWLARRQFCRHCLAVDGISPSYWDLKMYSVCHKHGVRMLRECSECRRSSNLSSRLPNVCGCGLPISEVTTNATVSFAERSLSRLLALSLQQAIDFADSTRIPKSSCRYRCLDWTVFLFEFLKWVLIPAFSKTYRTEKLKLDAHALNRLILAILGDHDYREVLGETVFLLYASETLKPLDRYLPPEIDPAIAKKLLDGCAKDIPFHTSLWKLHLSKPGYKVQRDSVVTRRVRSTVRLQPRSVFLIQQREFGCGDIRSRPGNPGGLAAS